MEIRLNMAASVENVGHETARDFHCDLLVGKGLEYDEREQHGRARRLAGYDIAVLHDRHAGAGTVEIDRTRRIACDVLAFLKDTGLDENSRRRAYGAEKAVFVLLAAKPRREGSRGLQVLRALAAAGKDDCVEVVLLRLGESASIVTPCALRTSRTPESDAVTTSTPPRRRTSIAVTASTSSKPSARITRALADIFRLVALQLAAEDLLVGERLDGGIDLCAVGHVDEAEAL